MVTRKTAKGSFAISFPASQTSQITDLGCQCQIITALTLSFHDRISIRIYRFVCMKYGVPVPVHWSHLFCRYIFVCMCACVHACMKVCLCAFMRTSFYLYKLAMAEFNFFGREYSFCQMTQAGRAQCSLHFYCAWTAFAHKSHGSRTCPCWSLASSWNFRLFSCLSIGLSSLACSLACL